MSSVRNNGSITRRSPGGTVCLQPIAIWSKADQGQVPDVFTWFGYDPLGRCVKRWKGPSDGSVSSDLIYLYYKA